MLYIDFTLVTQNIKTTCTHGLKVHNISNFTASLRKFLSETSPFFFLSPSLIPALSFFLSFPCMHLGEAHAKTASAAGGHTSVPNWAPAGHLLLLLHHQHKYQQSEYSKSQCSFLMKWFLPVDPLEGSWRPPDSVNTTLRTNENRYIQI